MRLLPLMLVMIFAVEAEASMRFNGRSIREVIREVSTVSIVGGGGETSLVCPDSDDKDVLFNNKDKCDGEDDFQYDTLDNSLDVEGHMAIGASAGADDDNITSRNHDIQILNVRETHTSSAGGERSVAGISSELIMNPDDGGSAKGYGISGYIETLATNSQTIPEIAGGFIEAVNDSTGTVTDFTGLHVLVTTLSGSSTTEGTGLLVERNFDVEPSRKKTLSLEDLNSSTQNSTSEHVHLNIADLDHPTPGTCCTFSIYIDGGQSGDDNILWLENISSFGGPITLGDGVSEPKAQLQISADFDTTTQGTVSSAGTTVTGTSTNFNPEARVGSIMRAVTGPQFRLVTARASDTSLTTATAFNPTLSGSAYRTLQDIIRIKFDGAIVEGGGNDTGEMHVINGLGSIGVYNSLPLAPIDIFHPDVGGVNPNDLEIVRLITQATSDDPNFFIRQARLQTTDGNQATLNTIAITASNTYMIEARVVARRTGGSSGTTDDGAVYVVRGGYTTVSGTVTLLGSINADFTAEDQAGWDATLTISGANVLVAVTAAANNDVTWHSTVFVQNVGI